MLTRETLYQRENPDGNDVDVGASWVFLVTTLEFMGGGLVVALEDAWSDTLLKKDWFSAWFGSLAWSMELSMVCCTRHALELGNACGSSMMLGFTGARLGLGLYWCRVVCEPTFGI